MFQIFANSMRLLLRGKLFRDNLSVFRQWLKGFLFTLVVLLAVGYVVSPLVGVICASLVGGALQPWLFKDLKYN